MLAAGDTFRAAAIEQLGIWATRAGAGFVSTRPGGDAAGLAFEALEKARAQNVDVLIIDTAGRLQNKTDLMAELEKIARVVKKLDPSAPHAVLLVLDATTGQNAISQVGAFGSQRAAHRPDHDQARRHRQRRHIGGAGGEIRAAGAFHRRGRRRGRSDAI